MAADSARARLLLVCVAILFVPVACSPNRQPSIGFVVIGDFGTGSTAEQAVSSAIRSWVHQRAFDALVTVGDNIYPNGSPSEFNSDWERPYGWVEGSHVPVVASLGNHDIHTDGGRPVMDLFGMPNRWYRRQVGPVDFFVLDANDLTADGQMQWLSSALRSSTAAWQVLVFHQPAYSCGKYASKPGVQRHLLPAIQGAGVDLVLNGHDHNYQRFGPINGTTYVVSGGGGASLNPVGDCPEGTPAPVASNDNEHEFLYVSATATELVGTAVSASGTVLDTFRLQNPAA
jgi:calcineurin-like phosphoesterase family protein